MSEAHLTNDPGTPRFVIEDGTGYMRWKDGHRAEAVSFEYVREIKRLREALTLVSDHAVPSTRHDDQNLISMWVLGEVRNALALPADVVPK